MEEEIAAKPHHPMPTTVLEKGSEMEDRFKKGVNRHSLHNGNNASIAINAVIPIIMQARKSVINGLPKESNNAENVIAGGINMFEVAEKALSVDGEPVTREGIKQKKPHVTARVSLHAKRILLSWICRSRPGTPTLKTATTKSIGKKRDSVNSSDYVELISKRLQISQNVDAPSIILAEADHQPCQEQ